MPAPNTQHIEKNLFNALNRGLPPVIGPVVVFVLKHLWAGLFAVLILAGIIASAMVWQDEWALARYDALVIYAVGLQILMLWFKLETWDEAKVILLFHLTGTVMEWFKVSAGSWAYPEYGMLKLFDVPLFTGFMYASVGSYIARVTRLFDMRFAPYPPLWMTFLFAILIYVNFFAHHFTYDIRWILFAASLLLFLRTRIWFRLHTRWRWVPLPLGAAFVALGLWVAENIGTMSGTWLYAGQSGWQMVSFAKFGSWYLLLYVSFVTVTVVHRNALQKPPFDPNA